MSEYIGGRVVPRHGGVWDSTKAYEPLIIVYEEGSGDSYISRKDVPAGTGLNQKEYWALCARFSEQAALLREETDGQVAGMQKLTTDTLNTMTQRTEAAEDLTNSNKAALEQRMANIEARQDANVSASTDSSADYAAEMVDARVGWDSTVYESLGAAVRGQVLSSLKYAGILQRISGTEDLNELPVNTMYLVSSTTGETTLKNFPDYGSHGLLLTVGVTDGFFYQVFYGGGGDRIFIRHHIASGWRPWEDYSENTAAGFEDLYQMLSAFGVEDILHRNIPFSGTRTVNGVTFTVNRDGSITATGTADPELPAFFNMYDNSSGFPEGIQAGENYVFRIAGDTENVRIESYVKTGDGSSGWEWFVSTHSFAEAAVPADSTGFLVRVMVPPGMSVDGATVYPVISRKFTAEEYQMGVLKYAGVLNRISDTDDLNEIPANTVKLVSSSTGETTLKNFPDIETHGLLITTGVDGAYTYQIFLTDREGALYVRFRYGDGRWVSWKNIAGTEPVERKIHAVRGYLAAAGIGDLLYGHIAMAEGTDNCGLVYTLNSQGSITVSGTNSSEGTVFHNLVVVTDGLPDWQKAGEAYVCGIYDDTGMVAIHGYWYGSEGQWHALFPPAWSRVRYTVPEEARGILFRLEVAGGAAVDTDVIPYIAKVDAADLFRHMGFLTRQTDTKDLDELPANTAYLISSDAGETTLENFPDYEGTGLLITIGEDGAFTYQTLITPDAGKYYLRFRYGNGTWAAWRNITDTEASAEGWRGTDPNSHMLSYGNSILSGSVWKEGQYNHLAAYYNAPYGVIANAIGIPKENVEHTVVSSTGLLYDAGNGSFLENIQGCDLTGYDVVLTHLWTADMNQYPVGTADAKAGDGSIAGGVVSLLEYMKASNGQCQLILVGVPPVSSTIYGEGVFSTAYPNGSSIEELDAVMHALEEKYHFAYIDWQGLNLSYYFHDYSDGTNVHANNEDTYRIMGGYLGARAAAKIRF